jgi:glyoxylase-like metal-dependent hydrolase (beta-lactamase superfamily II)/rhodanese-related sulfurtransferase
LKTTDTDKILEIEPATLKQMIDKGEDIFILDVRTPEEYEAWKISYDKQELSLIPIDQLSSREALNRIPRDKEIVTVCSHGYRSMIAAEFLTQLGYNARSVKGGMSGWNKVYDIAAIPVRSNLSTKIWQVRRVSKGCMGYVIASEADKNAVIIDPNCEIEESFERIANDNDLRVTKVIETHMHADHASASTSLAKTFGAVVYASSKEGYDRNENDSNDDEVTFYRIEDGDQIRVGQGIVLDAIHTPGHTKGSMSFCIDGNNNDSNDIHASTSYLFTGDTIFVNGIGRPDLHSQVEEFTSNLYDSYHRKILTFPNETVILPAHFGKRFEYHKPIFSTIGSVKKDLTLLSLEKEEFINYVSNAIPPQPVNYKIILRINKAMTPCHEVQTGELEAGPNSCGIPA